MGDLEGLGGGVGAAPPAQDAEPRDPERRNTDGAECNFASRNHDLSLNFLRLP
jgi:hypothetical protein